MVNPGQNGFTLLELLVVAMIMVFAYSLAAPLIGAGLAGTELKAGARQVAAGLRKARNQAIVHKHEATLLLDVENRRFHVTGDSRVYQLPGKPELALYTAQTEVENDATGAVRFYPDGSSTGGRITLSANERKYEVDVDWLTGRVAILEQP